MLYRLAGTTADQVGTRNLGLGLVHAETGAIALAHNFYINFIMRLYTWCCESILSYVC